VAAERHDLSGGAASQKDRPESSGENLDRDAGNLARREEPEMRRVVVGQGNVGEHQVGWRPATREVLHHQRLGSEVKRIGPADVDVPGQEILHRQERCRRDQHGRGGPALEPQCGVRADDEAAEAEASAKNDESRRRGEGQQHQQLRSAQHPQRCEYQQIDRNAHGEGIEDVRTKLLEPRKDKARDDHPGQKIEDDDIEQEPCCGIDGGVDRQKAGEHDDAGKDGGDRDARGGRSVSRTQ
jgi:hypothetical protein